MVWIGLGELLLRGIKVYQAILTKASERGWSFSLAEGGVLQVLISGGLFELAVIEKAEPVLGIRVWPGERRPRGQSDGKGSKGDDLRQTWHQS